MIFTLALRSLFAHPVRSAVLAAGFGLGVAVMAILLGVGQVVLEQARAPELVGGGDVLVTGATGQVTAARVLLAGALIAPPLGAWTRLASPWSRETIYFIDGSNALPVRARGGVPSVERALNDPEVIGHASWIDTPDDSRWTSPAPDDLLRAIDRFHPIPDVPARAASWAEWLYFNGRASGARFYLTFLAGPRRGSDPGDPRVAGVRLQLDRGEAVESFSASALLDDEELTRAPEITIANNHVRLDGSTYRLTLDLRDRRGRRATGELTLEASSARLVPPIEMHGATGWRTGYVVPVMSGALGGWLDVEGVHISLNGGAGYHDHNWGFWEGVSWQWGQVQHGDLSFVYGRVFPPRDTADPERLPGFLGALGPDGPIGYTTNMTITERNQPTGEPSQIVIRGRSESVELTMTFDVSSAVVTRMQERPLAANLDFHQLRGRYDVRGRVGNREVSFTAPGAAETFRGSQP